MNHALTMRLLCSVNGTEPDLCKEGPNPSCSLSRFFFACELTFRNLSEAQYSCSDFQVLSDNHNDCFLLFVNSPNVSLNILAAFSLKFLRIWAACSEAQHYRFCMNTITCHKMWYLLTIWIYICVYVHKCTKIWENSYLKLTKPQVPMLFRHFPPCWPWLRIFARKYPCNL